MQAGDYPLLIINEVSKGRVAQLLSDQSWEKDIQRIEVLCRIVEKYHSLAIKT